jgi:hypothetical protein
MAATREMAESLRAKYEEMLAMRLLHASGEEGHASITRARMAEIASRFPGALREIDELELGEIRRRIARLDAVLHESAEGEPWMEAVAAFHALARGALAVKRWLDGRRDVDEALEASFAAEVDGNALPEEVRSWARNLAQVAAPPRGRVMDLVFARVAERMGTTEAEARCLVFGPRQERNRGAGRRR